MWIPLVKIAAVLGLVVLWWLWLASAASLGVALTMVLLTVVVWWFLENIKELMGL